MVVHKTILVNTTSKTKLRAKDLALEHSCLIFLVTFSGKPSRFLLKCAIVGSYSMPSTRMLIFVDSRPRIFLISIPFNSYCLKKFISHNQLLQIAT